MHHTSPVAAHGMHLGDGDSLPQTPAPTRDRPVTATVVALLLLLFAAGLAFPYYGLGELSYVVQHDVGEMNVPRAVWFGDGQSLTGLGSWSPQALSGTDRLATGLSRDLSTLLFALLPGWLAYGLFLFLQRFIAAYFTYRLLREWGSASPWLAVAIGCLYALFVQPHINGAWTGFALYDGLALSGLPAVLFLMYRGAEWRPWVRYLATAAAGLALAFTSHFFVASFCVVAVIVVALVAFPRRSRRWYWVPPLVFTLAWLVGELPVLWAAAAAAPFSHRAARELYAARAEGRPAWIAGFLLDNAAALGMTGAALVLALWRRAWRVLALAVVAAVAAALVYLVPEIRDQVMARLGAFSGFRIDRMAVVVPFLLLLAGGAGLSLLPRCLGAAGTPLADDLLVEETSKPGVHLYRTRRRLCVSLQALVGVLVLGFAAWQAYDVQSRVWHELQAGSTYASFFRDPRLQELAATQTPAEPFRVASVNAPLFRELEDKWHPGYLWAYGLETADGYLVLYSQRYQRFWAEVLESDVGRHARIKATFLRGSNRAYLYADNYNLRRKDGIEFARRWNLALLSLANVRYIVSPTRLRDPGLEELASPQRAQQLAWLHLSLGEQRERMARGEYPGLPLWVYRNRQELPRAFLTRDALVLDTYAEVLGAMGASSAQELRETVFFTRSDAAGLDLDRLGDKAPQAEAEAADEAAIRAYAADEVVVRTEAQVTSLLVVGNSYSTYWRAWVDGRPTEVAPADYTFLGVLVPPGRHEVRLTYEPPYRHLVWQ